jgi:hypothetical protein
MSKPTPTAILDRCRKLGLSLWVEDGRIGIAPKKRIPPGLLDEIRQAKTALLPLVRDRSGLDLPGGEILKDWPTGRLAPQQGQRGGTAAQWVHVAKQILAREFDGAGGSTCESLFTGLRGFYAYPAARLALEWLSKEEKCPKNVRSDIAKLIEL